MITSTSIFKTAGLVHLPLGVNICLYFYRTYSTCSAELVTFSCSYTTCWATLVTFRSLFFQIYTACWATLNNSRPCDSRVWPVHSWFHLVFAATFFALSLPAFFLPFLPQLCFRGLYILCIYILQLDIYRLAERLRKSGMVGVGLPISVFRPVMKIRVHQCGNPE